MSGRRIIIGGRDVTDAVRASVDNAPPLTPERRDQLREILAPGRAVLAARLRQTQTQNGAGPATGPATATDVPSPKETSHERKPARAA